MLLMVPTLAELPCIQKSLVNISLPFYLKQNDQPNQKAYVPLTLKYLQIVIMSLIHMGTEAALRKWRENDTSVTTKAL